MSTNTARRACALGIFSLMMSLLPARSSMAGTGTIEDGKLNLSAMFAYFENDPDSWRPLFEQANELLYNATDGQLQLGTIRLITCQFDKESADIWIMNNETGAFATVRGLGGDGHIFLSQLHKSTSGSSIGQFGLVHEIGHYALGLFDEYKGCVENAVERVDICAIETSFEHFCVASEDLVGCIMDGGSGAVPGNGRTEFCTITTGGLATAHVDVHETDDRRFINAQEAYNAQSCWETIADLVGLSEPGELDTTDPPGLEPITWEIVENVDRVVIGIDRSGSMFGPKLTLAKAAASQFVDLMHPQKTVDLGNEVITVPGEGLSVLSFYENTFVDFAMAEITGDETKLAARDAIAAINAEGHSDLGKLLDRALSQLDGASETLACSEAVVLLSDGRHTGTRDPLGVAATLAERGVKVHPIAIGVDADLSLLQRLASITGGRLSFASSRVDLAQVLARISADIRDGVIASGFREETGGEFDDFIILIKTPGEELTTTLSWDAGALDLVLTSPAGERITVESAAARDDVQAARQPGFAFIRVLQPMGGQWTATVEPIEVDGTVPYVIANAVSSQSVQVTARTDQDVYELGEPIRLQVDVVSMLPVAGADVTATVDRPGATPIEITLFDDGEESHGDDFAGDGVYSVLFDDVVLAGLYDFRIHVVNEIGTGPSASLPFVEEGGTPWEIPIAPFVREIQSLVVVRGAEVERGELALEPGSIGPDTTPSLLRCIIEPPPSISAHDVDVTSIRVNDAASARVWPVWFTNVDRDRYIEVNVYVSIDELLDVMSPGTEVPVWITGRSTSGAEFVVASTIEVIVDKGERPAGVPRVTAFLGAFPNPTSGGTELRFALADAGSVRLDVFDVQGRLVRQLVVGNKVAGEHAVVWDGDDAQGRAASPGVYLYVFESGGRRVSGRIMKM